MGPTMGLSVTGRLSESYNMMIDDDYCKFWEDSCGMLYLHNNYEIWMIADCTVGVVIMTPNPNFNIWGTGYDYTINIMNFLLKTFILSVPQP